MGMFDQAMSRPYKNTEETRNACAQAVMAAITAGTFRVTDTFAAPNPWSTMAREVLAGYVGREKKPFGIDARLVIRLAIEQSMSRSIGQTVNSFGDVDRVEPIMERFDPGVHDVPIETALWLLNKAGVGVVEHTTPDGRGAVIEIGYTFGRQFYETLPEGTAPKAPEKGTLRERVTAVLNGAPLAPTLPVDEADALRARIAELEAQVAAKAAESPGEAKAPKPAKGAQPAQAA